MASTPETSRLLSWIGRGHQAFVFQRRARVLAELLAAQIPQRATVLDVGCGDGTIGSLIAQLRPDVAIQGAEFQVRSGCKIPCQAFDGKKLPFGEASFDVSLFVDVLHHTQDPAILLDEAARVSRFVLIKDHLAENFLDHLTLRFMDWIGNRPHGVPLTYNYQSRDQWRGYFSACGLTEASWTTHLPLYPPPFSVLFGRGLHFVSLTSSVPGSKPSLLPG